MALDWFRSYLSEDTSVLMFTVFPLHALGLVMEFHMVLSSDLFTLYVIPLGAIIGQHVINFHCSADDIQL